MDYKDTKGRIFDIQRFSVHDGPGIRTIVFLKGCILRCRWCCNPESQRFEIETMIVHGKEKVIGKDVTVREVMETVVKDRPYYRRSGGGITLSGGESLLQPEFASALLKAAKEAGINTALESTACAPFENVSKLLPWLDTYLLDIKHMDADKHRKFTGKTNRLILENAEKIARSKAVELVVRVPVIPGFNDTREEIEKIAAFARGLSGVRKMHLLPYHRLGQDKYIGLGRKYELEGVLPPSGGHMEMLRKAAEEKAGIVCQIGG